MESNSESESDIVKEHRKRLIEELLYQTMPENPEDYERKFKPYRIRLVCHGIETFDPEDECVDVRMIAKRKEYTANFVTPKFLERMSDKNRQTGECADGAYFAMPGMVVVQKIDTQTVRRTIEDMIKNREVENYFKEL